MRSDRSRRAEANESIRGEHLAQWVQCKIELDKQILTITVSALGFLVLIAGNLRTQIEVILWVFAAMSFVAALLGMILALKHNVGYLSPELSPDQKQWSDRYLQMASYWVSLVFSMGVLCTIALAFMGAVSKM